MPNTYVPLDNLNETYCYFNEIDKQQTKKKIIDNIKNSMSGGSQVILLSVKII